MRATSSHIKLLADAAPGFGTSQASQVQQYASTGGKVRPRLILPYLLVTLVLAIVVARVIAADRERPQGFDEPAHVAAGMEWLQFHTYHLDPLHPPLARLAAAVPLYIAGVRFHEPDPTLLPQFWDAGNSLLYTGDYLKNLSFARFGILPFFALLLIVVYIWTRRCHGRFAALVAIMLVSTLPVILSFSSLAYTDLPAASMQFVCIFAFITWLGNKPTLRSTAILGALFGLAVLTKFTSLVYIPVAAGAILACRCRLARCKKDRVPSMWRARLTHASLCIVTMAVVVWGGYRFSRGGIAEALGIDGKPLPTFQHFPGPVRGLARDMISSDWKIPAPSFFVGLGQVWVLDKSKPDAYLFGRSKQGGWWYFFIVEVVFKTPLPFLLFVLIGSYTLWKKAPDQDPKPLAPAVAAVSLIAVSTLVSVNSGLRHVLLLFPLMAIVAAAGVRYLWNIPRGSFLGRVAVAGLLGWQVVAVLRPGRDWISYFNELAGSDPSRILVTGCDLDCGQDVLRLSAELPPKYPRGGIGSLDYR
jgi:hypothetical protein